MMDSTGDPEERQMSSKPAVPASSADLKSTAESGLGEVSPCYHFADMAGDRQIVLIEHNGQTYQLRCTRAGKLLLQK